ncbi:MAG: c-type cytochrome [Kiloniellales bacterium]
MTRLPTLPLLLLVAALALPFPAQAAGEAAKGKALAEANCAACHRIEGMGMSPVPKAPPFVAVAHRWPPDQLAEALGDGIMAVHSEPPMPAFELTAEETDDLIAYLSSLRQP